jgi:hypothetical protein
MQYGWQGYGLFWGLVEMLGETSNYQLPADYQSLSFALQIDESTIKSVVEDFGLFVVKDGTFYSKSLKVRMKIRDEEHKKKSEGGKKGNEMRWKGNQAKPLSREEERMNNVYGEEVEQDTIRNPVHKYEV